MACFCVSSFGVSISHRVLSLCASELGHRADNSAHAYLFKIPREAQVHPLPGPRPDHSNVFPRPHWVSSSSISSSNASTTSGENHQSRLRRFRRWSTRPRSLSDGSIVRPIPQQIFSEPNPEHICIPDLDIEAQTNSKAMPIRTSSQRHLGFSQPTHQLHMRVKPTFAIAMLILMTALAGVTAEWLVDSIDGLTATGNVSREFVGLILLPVIGTPVANYHC